MAITNAAFVRDGLEVTQGYRDTLERRYLAQLFAMGLEDVNDQVNAWVNEKTMGLIGRLLDQPPDPNLMLMLVNALALKADWRIPFTADQTWKQTFRAPDGDYQTDFMHTTRALPYAQLDGMRAVRLEYADSTLALAVILPDADIQDALARLEESPVDWGAALSKSREVALALPKLSAEDSVSLIDAMKALGVSDAFDTRADFSGIDGTRNLFIGSILQKTRLDMDEKGTTAAAATAVGITAKDAVQEEPVYFTVDKPYLLLLTDDETDLVLFTAAIDKP